MLVDFSTPILDLEGTPMKAENGPPFLLKTACQTALTATFADEPSLSGPDKVARFALAMKINKLLADISIEEAALLKTLIAKAYGPLVVGRAYELLEKAAAS